MTSKNAVATKIFPLTSKQRYDISSNTWTSTNDVSAVGLEMYTSHTSPDSDGTLPKVATGMSTYVQSLNRGYAMGGLSYRDNLPSTTQDGRAYMAHRGLLKYDQKADAWTNSTMPIDRVRQGVLTHLKSDTGEILITFAGSTQDPTTSESQASMVTTPAPHAPRYRLR